MATTFRFTFEKDWRRAPVAFWVHVPVPGGGDLCDPPAPRAISRRGYAVLRVAFGEYELEFSDPAQLDHCIAVLSSRPLPTSRQLAARRGLPVGPNGHWLSRLPARLKAPRKREQLVRTLRAVREQAVHPGPHPSFALAGCLIQGSACKSPSSSFPPPRSPPSSTTGRRRWSTRPRASWSPGASNSA
jgi:hypothetical protein